MENNQEHKIDKIFKQSLDNQSVKPPSDAWMSIHTYTIGQEESKRKVWFRYASLSIVLLILGLGLWYIGDKQKVVNDKLIVKNTSNRLASELLLKNTKNERNSILKTPKTALENAGRVLNPDSVRTPNQIVYLDNQSGGLQISRVKSVIQSPKPLKHEKFASLKTIEKQPLIIEIVEDSSINYNTQFEGTVSNFNDNNIHEIKSKPLILNDLVNKMQTEKESRIVLINRVSKRNIIESDTIIEHKKKLSLRNPIITFAGGNSWNYWNIQRNIPVFSGAGITNLNNSGITIKVGIAWKINNKLRFGMSLIHNNIKLTDGSNFYNFKNNETEEFLKIKRDKNLLNQFYTSLSPFGGNINVDSTSLFNYDPVIIASSALQFTIYHVPNSMRTISVSFNSN